MAEVLAEWADYSGGHWGALGPAKAKSNQWGGVNMIPTRQGGLTPACASRVLTLGASVVGKVWGMHWAYGSDGRVYYIQQAGTSTSMSTIYRFTPDPGALPNAIATTSTVAFVPTTDPDWVNVGTTVYVTFYGNKSYAINTGANTIAKLTGSDGDAPAGRAVCLYGEQLLVGGISDARYGSHANRIIFSGDLTSDPTVPEDRTAWQDLNFFDLGADNSFITGLYVIRDFLVAITEDQQIWVLTGTPGSTLSARRVYGFNKASGGLTAFKASHAQVDPSQTKIWMFDHAIRGPQRFNGANVTRVAAFGSPRNDREGDDLVEGAVAMIGGPDEFLTFGIAPHRSFGQPSSSAWSGSPMMLERLQGMWTLHEKRIIGEQTFPADFSPLDFDGVGGINLEAWYDASDTSTVTGGSNSVTQWRDKSGNTRHLNAASGNPSSGTRTINSKNVIDFNGTNQRITSSTISSVGAPLTFFVIGVTDSTTADQVMVAGNTSNSLFWPRRTSATFAADGSSVISGGTTTTSPFVATMILNGASSSLRVNGVEVASGNTGTNSLTDFLVGFDGAAANWLNGAVGEWGVYSGATLSANQIQTIETYLAEKWGVTI